MDIDPQLLDETRRLLKTYVGNPQQAIEAAEKLIAAPMWCSYTVACALAMCATEQNSKGSLRITLTISHDDLIQ